MLDEILRLSEVELSATAETARFRDQRGVALGAVSGSMAAAGLGAFGVGLSGEEPLLPLVWGAGVFAVLMLLAAACCFWSARPSSYYVPGLEPSRWVEDIKDGVSLHQGKAEVAALYDAAIKADGPEAKRQQECLQYAAVLAVLAVICGGMGALYGG